MFFSLYTSGRVSSRQEKRGLPMAQKRDFLPKKAFPPPTQALFKLRPPPLPLPQSLYVRVDVRWRHNQIFLDG